MNLITLDRDMDSTNVAEVREIFSVPRIGALYGCCVVSGLLSVGDIVHIVRDGSVVGFAMIQSLRRFTNDVERVGQGAECGITLTGVQNVRLSDTIEVIA